eukprot:12597868-Alexandrium_andersonii.AAC.1
MPAERRFSAEAPCRGSLEDRSDTLQGSITKWSGKHRMTASLAPATSQLQRRARRKKWTHRCSFGPGLQLTEMIQATQCPGCRSNCPNRSSDAPASSAQASSMVLCWARNDGSILPQTSSQAATPCHVWICSHQRNLGPSSALWSSPELKNPLKQQ